MASSATGGGIPRISRATSGAAITHPVTILFFTQTIGGPETAAITGVRTAAKSRHTPKWSVSSIADADMPHTGPPPVPPRRLGAVL